MKNLSSTERKHILLGIILMWGAILLFILQTDASELKTFKIFLPIFWGIFTVVTLIYVLVQTLMQHSEIKKLEDQNISTDEIVEKDSRNGNSGILKSANILALVAMVAGYFTSSIKNMPIQYTTYQPVVWVVILCFDICMYMVALFKDEPKEEKEKKPEEDEERVGVQIISIEEAVKYLECQGYEIENIDYLRIESKQSEHVLEDKSSKEEAEEVSVATSDSKEEQESEKEAERKEEVKEKYNNFEHLTKKVDSSSENLPAVSSTRNNPKVTVVVKKKQQQRHNNNKRRKEFK